VRVRVPLVILTGFLGSGKTTLLNRLLARRAQDGSTGKLGVIVNELGEVGIDGALLGGASTRQIELPGGCVCCVLGDDLDRTLLDLVDANPNLEAIVLETTGVAEPLPIAWALRRAPVAERVRLAAVVTLVDAANFVASRSLSVAVDAQVAYADVVLVTKQEIADDRDIAAAIAAVSALAPRALILRGTTDVHAAWLEQTLADPYLDGQQTPQPDGESSTHIHDENCRHSDHAPGLGVHGIDSVWAPATAPVDLEELEDQLADLPGNYVRIKGIVRTTDGSWAVVHRVGLRVSSEPVGPPESEQGRIVALGPGVERDALAACITAATA